MFLLRSARKKLCELGQDQMEVVQRLNLQLQRLSFQIQHVATVLMIARQEVQVVSRHAGRA